MSPRQTRAGTMEQSVIITRARAQKLNNMNESIIKTLGKTRQLQRREKLLDIKDNFETSTRENDIKELPNAEVPFDKSVKKKVSHRKHKFIKEIETVTCKSISINFNKSNKIMNDRHSDNIATTKPISYNNISHLSNFEDLNPDKTPKKLQQNNAIANLKVSPNIVTPKSIPIKLSFIPHRSTKTPKKSPISLSSPKTHSIAIPKLRTPRKLSLTPEKKNLDKSNNSLRDEKLQEIKRENSLDNIFVSKKNVSTSAISSKHSKCGVNLKEIVRKFSKSPKIVLKSPKSKKSKLLSKLKLSPSRVRKSPLKESLASTIPNVISDYNTVRSLSMSKKEISLPKDKYLSPIKPQLLDSRLMKILTASQMRDMLAEPIVLLERLSPQSMQNILSGVGKEQLDTLINVVNSSKMSTLTTRNTFAEPNMFAHMKNTCRDSTAELMKRSTRLSSNTEYNTLIQQEKRSSIPLMSSTPREEMSPIDTNFIFSTPIVSMNDVSSNTRSRYKDQSIIMQVSSMTDRSIAIENVSKLSLFDKDINDVDQTCFANTTKRDVTYDVIEDAIILEEERKNKKDITYELKQPQTPNLRRMMKKHTAIDIDLNAKEDIKRACKVHFANLTSGESNAHKSVNKSIGLLSSVIKPHNNATQRSIVMNSVYKSRNSKVGIRTPKFNQNPVISSLKTKPSPIIDRVTPKTQSKNRRSYSLNTMTPNRSLNRIQTTSKIFVSTEKKSEKKSSIKKVPNFGRIHEKMFAKSESLVDAKKRLENRHVAFAMNKVLPKLDMKKEVKLLPTDTSNGTHNRFGFKLRKAEATHVVLKKQTVFSRQKQQHETRVVLKGVRTNRRFELQMKARNINS